MFIVYLIYFALLFFIWWGIFGYTELLVILSIFFQQTEHKSLKKFPTITIIVPFFNEETMIEQKLKNLRDLDYPAEKLSIIFVDGQSTDKGCEILAKLIKGKKKEIQLVTSKIKGKINQLNYGISLCHSDIIVNTDADAILHKNSLLEMAKVFENEKKVGVVGGYVMPRDCHSVEYEYWLHQNEFRVIESNISSTSIVIAPCYAFRKEVLTSFPEDCIADDIYISFFANVKGYEVKYCKSISVFELRTPKSLRDIVLHKFRKSNAYLIEVLRFLYRIPYMTGFWKLIYLTKLLQLVFLPIFIFLFLLMSFNFTYINIPNIVNAFVNKSFDLNWLVIPGLQTVIVTGLFLLVNLILIKIILGRSRKQYKDNAKDLNYEKKSSVVVFFFIYLIMLMGIFVYPFYRQAKVYKKI